MCSRPDSRVLKPIACLACLPITQTFLVLAMTIRFASWLWHSLSCMCCKMNITMLAHPAIKDILNKYNLTDCTGEVNIIRYKHPSMFCSVTLSETLSREILSRSCNGRNPTEFQPSFISFSLFSSQILPPWCHNYLCSPVNSSSHYDGWSYFHIAEDTITMVLPPNNSNIRN